MVCACVHQCCMGATCLCVHAYVCVWGGGGGRGLPFFFLSPPHLSPLAIISVEKVNHADTYYVLYSLLDTKSLHYTWLKTGCSTIISTVCLSVKWLFQLSFCFIHSVVPCL